MRKRTKAATSGAEMRLLGMKDMAALKHIRWEGSYQGKASPGELSRARLFVEGSMVVEGGWYVEGDEGSGGREDGGK